MITGPLKTSAQHDKEFGVLLGMTQYSGDLIKNDGFAPENFGGGILYRYYFNPYLGFKANAYYGTIHASDWENQPHNEVSPYTRNLSFKSHIFDISTQLELNILPFISGSKKRYWAPYVFGGVALFNFNPQAEYPAGSGKWYDLQPLGTEGQGTQYGGAKYKLTDFALAYGIGFKYGFKRPKYFGARINLEKWNIGLEITQRKTLTDHLDDVGGYYPESLSIFGNNDIAKKLCDRSWERDPTATRIVEGSKTQPRGETKYKDYYMFYGVTITRTIRPSGCFGF
jgi:hypothetical protein